MKKQEFLAMSLPYGLFIKFDKYEDITDELAGMEIGSDGIWYCHYDEFGDVDCNIVKPIIRPLYDLSKSIVQADYNDGNPFVPIEILSGLKEYYTLYEEYGCVQIRDKKSLQVYSFNSYNPSFKDAMLLIKWHFWPGMSEGEQVVYVTDDFNPYNS
jgi:hypothetical protein